MIVKMIKEHQAQNDVGHKELYGVAGAEWLNANILLEVNIS